MGQTSFVSFVSTRIGTFSNDDEDVDDEVYDRLRPGTGRSSTAGNKNTLAHRRYVDESFTAAFCGSQQENVF